MIKINEVAFTGYPVTDQARARAFYEGIFQLKASLDMQSDAGFWIEYDVAGSTLAISNFWSGVEKKGPCIAFEVDDFPAAIEELKAKGVSFDNEPMEFPGCHFAVIMDPDGNLITIHQRKPGRT